jgi:transposase
MQRYIALDVHQASTTLAVLSEAGKQLKSCPVETNGRALVEAIRMIPGHKRLVIEEGTQSAWLYETLSPHVDEMIVTQPAQSRGQKNDALDAYRLAEKLRMGTLDKIVFKAPRQFALLRELARTHTMIARDVVRVQCRIKSIYRSRGVQAPRRTAYSQRTRVELLAQLPTAARSSAERLYEQYDFLVSLKARAHSDLIAESHKHAITRILETAPGMGPIRVAQLVSIVVTPHRFRTKRQFWSYCGLSIVMRSSSDWVRTPEGGWIRGRVQQTRGLTRQHNHTLKEIFKGAATTVVTQPDTYALYAAYEHMTNSGTKPNLAKVTLARMIAAIVLRMWKDEERYQPRHTTESKQSASQS